MTETELILGCRKGEIKAQRVLYDQYGPQLMGLCLRYTGLREDAEEVFHDTLMKVYNKIGDFKGDSSLKTWINRIGINTCLDFLRKSKHALMVEHISDNALEIKDSDLDREISLDAETAMYIMQQMPLNQQIVINLYTIDEMSHREIARELGISEEASRSQYSRAKRTLTALVKTRLKVNEQKQ